MEPRQLMFECVPSRESMAIERIRTLGKDGMIVAYSGGKDSTVLLDLARRSGLTFRAVYHLTTADPPELVQYIKRQPDVEISLPEHSMWKWLEIKAIPPTHVARWCCQVLKHRDMPGSVVLTGIRWAESPRRSARKMAEYHGHRRIINPIIDWTDMDVWEYIDWTKAEHSELYSEGWSRLGCVGCPLSNQRNRDEQFRRWPKTAGAWERAIVAAWDERVKRNLQLSGEWTTPDSMVEWWMSGAYRKAKEDYQCPGLFDHGQDEE